MLESKLGCGKPEDTFNESSLVLFLFVFTFCIFYHVPSNRWTLYCGHSVIDWQLQNLFLAIVHIIRRVYVGCSDAAACFEILFKDYLSYVHTEGPFCPGEGSLAVCESSFQ